MKLTDKIHLLKHDFEITLGPGKSVPRFVNSMIIFRDEITLILSHSHPDHIGSTMKLKSMTGCKILAHEAEKEWMENIEIQQQERPVPGFLILADESVLLDGFLHQNQEIKASEDLTLRIIHSPGVLFKCHQGTETP